jgi:hypothetical protein
MKFINTTDLICGREISLNIQNVEINYVEKVGPKISIIHFSKGGIVKVPLSKDYIVSQLLEANAPQYVITSVPQFPQMPSGPMKTPAYSKEDMELKEILKDGTALMEGGERRKAERRSVSAIEKPPTKPKSEDEKT